MNTCLNEYIIYLKSVKNRSQNTIAAYEHDIVEFINWIDGNIEDASYSKIKLQNILEYIEHLDQMGNSPRTKARKISSIKSFFRFLVKTGNIVENIVENVDSPSIPHTLPKIISKDNVKKLVENVDNVGFGESFKTKVRDKAIILVFLNCGVRIGELIKLKLCDVDLKDQSLLVHGKGAKERKVYLSKSTTQYLDKYIAMYRPLFKYASESDYLFLSTNSATITTVAIRNMLKSNYEKNGIDKKSFSAHSLRKTSATMMFDAGEDIRTIQTILGHSNIETTTIYVGVNEDIKRNAANMNFS